MQGQQRKERLIAAFSGSNSSVSGVTIKPKTVPLKQKQTPVDEVFDMFCAASNDEIMNYKSNSVDSLEATQTYHAHRINVKLLNEILQTEIDDPQLSLRSSRGNASKNRCASPCSDSTSARSYERAARNYENSLTKNRQRVAGDKKENDDSNDEVFLDQDDNGKFAQGIF